MKGGGGKGGVERGGERVKGGLGDSGCVVYAHSADWKGQSSQVKITPGSSRVRSIKLGTRIYKNCVEDTLLFIECVIYQRGSARAF